MRQREPLTDQQAREYALRLLRQRNYSSHTLKQKIILRGGNSEQADAIVSQFTELKLLDDARYAESLIRHEATFRRASNHFIEQKLKSKGILTQVKVSENYDVPAEIERAYHHAQKYIRTKQDLSWNELRNKLSAYLYRRGFNSAVISAVISKVHKDLST